MAWYDVGLFAGGFATCAVLWAGRAVWVRFRSDIAEVPSSDLSDVPAVERMWAGRVTHSLESSALDAAEARGYERCVRDFHAKRSAAGKKAAETRRLRDTIIGGDA